jgi:hypothetical protein
MNPEEIYQIYEIWIPPSGVWSLWARPVPFAQMGDFAELAQLDEQRKKQLGSVRWLMPGLVTDSELVAEIAKETTPARPDMPAELWLSLDVSWAPGPETKTVLVVDLPGLESVWTGLALTRRGYRPVPLYNACTGPNEVVEMTPIMRGLRAGAPYLASLPLATDAPPAFLIDANRMTHLGAILPGMFDNRWKVFPQDFPSARFLIEKGYSHAVLTQRGGREPKEDLAHVLRRWADAGIALEAKNLTDRRPPEPIDIAKPPWYRAFAYRARQMLGLRRAPRGGFGSEIPKPSHG